MKRSRLFHAVVVVGVSMASGVALPACSDDDEEPVIDSPWGTIADAPIFDAAPDSPADGPWGTIADAPLPDAGEDAA